MRYIIPTLGRPETQRTLQSLPKSLLHHIELMVVPSEYKTHKKQWYSGLVKEIHSWPSHIDMMPKKRKWLALNAGSNFLMLDDDLSLFSWSKKEQRYKAAKDAETVFSRRFLEVIPSLYENHSMVSVPMKFMADMFIKQTQTLEKYNDVGFVVTGFKKGAADKVEFNRVFAFTDMTVPMQVLELHKRSVTYYGLCFSQSSAAIYRNTGMNSYRTDFIKKDSALKMLQLHPGVVTDFRFDKGQGGGVSLKKFTRRLLTKPTQAHIDASKAALERWLTEFKLSAAPKIFTYDDHTPRDEIIRQMKVNWKKVQDK